MIENVSSELVNYQRRLGFDRQLRQQHKHSKQEEQQQLQ